MTIDLLRNLDDPFEPGGRDRWRAWLDSPAGRRSWSGWAARHPELAGWRAGDLVAPQSSDRTDAMQAGLVAVAQDGEPEAASGLFIQLRPGLLILVRRHAVRVGAEAGMEVRSTFLETIYRHPLDRRPRRIAANLLLDTRHRLGRADRGPRATRWPDHLDTGGGDGGRFDALGSPADDEGRAVYLLDCLARAVEELPGSADSRRLTAEVAVRAWVMEQEHRLIAADLGIGIEAVRSRLYRLRGSLRQSIEATNSPG